MVGQDILIVTCLEDKKKIGFILFTEDKLILSRVFADPMKEELVRSLRIIQGEIEQCLAVVCPLYARVKIDAAIRVWNGFGIERARPQILDVKGVNLAAFDVQRVGELVPIRADGQCTDTTKRSSFG